MAVVRWHQGYFKDKQADILMYENRIIANLGGYRGFALVRTSENKD